MLTVEIANGLIALACLAGSAILIWKIAATVRELCRLARLGLAAEKETAHGDA